MPKDRRLKGAFQLSACNRTDGQQQIVLSFLRIPSSLFIRLWRGRTTIFFATALLIGLITAVLGLLRRHWAAPFRAIARPLLLPEGTHG